MLSGLLGLTIDKGDLNKSSPSPVANTLKKTAINYLAIGKMANDLKLIRLNFSRWLAIEGVKVRGTPDANMLKEDELSKKFNVQREKYLNSKVSKVSQDGTGGNKGLAKTLLSKYVNYKVSRSIERKIAASVLKRYKKLTWIRNFVRFKKKLLSKLNGLLSKLNIKKMFMEWFRKNVSKIMKPLVQMFTNALKRFVKKGLTKLIQRATVSILASLWSGPFVPFVAGAIFIGLILWEPIKEAWEAYTKGEDFVDKFIVSVIDSITFGIFGQENIKDFKDMFAEWLNTMATKVFDGIDKSVKFIEEKFTSFADFIVGKAKSLFTNESRPADFKSSFEEMNSKRIQDESREREQYGKYFDQMGEKIEQKKIKIRQLDLEIATLEYDIKYLTEGPEKANLEAAKVEKAKTEKEKAELEKQRGEQFQGIGDAGDDEKKPLKKETKPSTVPKKVEQAGAVTPAKPTPAPVPTTSKPSPTSGQYENIKQMVIGNEGWKNKPYKDSRGLWTVGVGHLIGNGKTLPKEWDREFSNQEVRELFEKDFTEHLKLAEKAPGWDKANEAGKAGLIDLTYNMGGYWYKKFKVAAGLLADGKFKEAADEFKSSKWYKQVGERAPATVSLIRSGAANDKGGSTALASVMSSSKVASAGKFIGGESTQLAQAQREQMKPKDVNVVNVAKVNTNKKTENENIAMTKPGPDSQSILVNRASA
jgi:lysozyme